VGGAAGTGEFLYEDAPRTIVTVISPGAFAGYTGTWPDTTNAWSFDYTGTEGFLQSSRDNARLRLDLNQYLPAGCVFTQCRVLVKPGDTRPAQTTTPGDNGRMRASIFQTVPTFTGVEAQSFSVIGFGTPDVEDDGTTDIQTLTMSGFAFTPAKATAGLELIIGAGNNAGSNPTSDGVGAVELTFEVDGPRRD
jgi:hypothetical protein